MQERPSYQHRAVSEDRTLEINSVLRNTYMLLGMTLLNSAVFASIAIALNISHGMALILMLVGFGMIFVVRALSNSAKGLLAVFAFTALFGASLGPMLQHYLALPNGPSLVMQALGGTAVVFFSLSGYALISRRDFSFMGGFLMVGLIVVVIAAIANIFLQIPAASLAISSAVVLIMSGLILFETSRVIHGGETNYINATVGLYLSIFNLFVHLLHLLGVFGND